MALYTCTYIVEVAIPIIRLLGIMPYYIFYVPQSLKPYSVRQIELFTLNVYLHNMVYIVDSLMYS